jgi:hypothetical protein
MELDQKPGESFALQGVKSAMRAGVATNFSG